MLVGQYPNIADNDAVSTDEQMCRKILVDAVPCGCGPKAISLLSEEVGILIPGNHYTSKDSLFKCTVLCHACDTPGNQTCLVLLCAWLLRKG